VPREPLPTIWRVALAELQRTVETVTVTFHPCRRIEPVPIAVLIDHGGEILLAELGRRWQVVTRSAT
jgi:hypothetical protein